MSDTLDMFLGQFYGTTESTKEASATGATTEDQEKVAMFDLFIKVATEQGVDLGSMDNAAIDALYAKFEDGVKQASAQEPAAPVAAPAQEQVAEKTAEQLALEAAQAEHAEKVAAAEKLAEADFLGRQMAHAFVDELKKVAAAEKAAEFPPAKDDKGDKGDEKKDDKAPPFAKKDDEKKDEKKEASVADAAKAAQAKLASSNFDVVAANYGVELVKAAGGSDEDVQTAGRKLASVLELGLNKESVKTAGIADFKQAVHVRALELLETAGYKVDWNA